MAENNNYMEDKEMVFQYSDNALVYFFKVAAVFSVYGTFSVTLFFFLVAFFTFFYVHRKLYSSKLYDDETNFQEYAHDTLDDDQNYDGLAVLHNRYFSLLRSLFYFYSFLWFLTYFGVEKVLYIYLLFGLLFYAYLYARRDFRGYERSYLNRISLLDPRPGFFVPSDFSDNIDDSFVFRFLEDSETKPFLDTRFQVLRSPKSLSNYGNANSFNLALSKDPYVLSKILYYYADIYVYNSIHNFWVAVSSVGLDVVDKQIFKNPGSYVNDISMRFYPTEQFELTGIPAGATLSASYIKSQVFLFNTAKDVYRSTAARSFGDSLYLRYLHDPFFRLGVAVSGNRSCFPYYKEHSGFSEFRDLIGDFLLSPARLEFLLQNVKREFAGDETFFRSITSNFNLKIKGSLFGMFPSSYYFKWLSFFLSFFLAETSLNFRFKNILVPEHWFNLSSLYRHKRKPSRTTAGLYLSRLATRQSRYNTGHTRKRGVLEFVFNSYMCPVTNRSRSYYYVNGFARFNILDSFDFVSLLLEPFFTYPAKAYVNYARSRKEGSGGVGSRGPLKVFEIRDVIRKSGDGMEPFLSTDYFMSVSNISFVNDLSSAAFDGIPEVRDTQKGLYEDTLSVFSSLVDNSFMKVFRDFAFKCDRLVSMPLCTDPGWSVLESAVESNPTFKIYLRNLAYSKYSSEFYEWFGTEYFSKPLFSLCELSLDLFVKSPKLLKMIIGDRMPLLPRFHSVGTLAVFGNYQRLLNRGALKTSGYGRLFLDSPGPIKFRLNRVRRSKVSGISSISLPLYKRPYVYFNQLRPRRLGTISSISTLKLLDFEPLAQRVKRSKLRVLFRDPFLFFSKTGKVGRERLFRRFLWENIFLKPTVAAVSGAVASPPEDFPKALSAFLLKNLTPWICDNYGFSQTYVNYLFSDLTIFREYAFFSYRENGLLENTDLWASISRNQFDVPFWKSYLSLLFSDNRFYSYSISKRYPPALALSNLLLDGEASMDLLLRIKDNYVLQFPTKYMNFMAAHSSGGSTSFGRGTWKLLVSTLNALVYLLIRSVLGEGRLSFSKPLDNFFMLLEQLRRDLKPYNYMSKYLFLTLDPLFDLKSMPGVVPDDSAAGSLLYFESRARKANWWEGIPNSTVFKAVEHVLQSSLPAGPVVDRYSFVQYMTSSWDDSDKREFVVSLKKLSSAMLSSSVVLGIFDAASTRASTVAALMGGSLDDGLKRAAYSIFLNEFRFQDSRCTAPFRRYSDSVWGLDSFYGLKNLSNFIFNAKIMDSSSAESYLSDVRLFYTETTPSMLSAFQAPATLRPRLGTFKDASALSLDSLNNALRSSWYYSLFTRKPDFHHERLSLSILKGGGYLYLNDPVVSIKFSRVPFLYFALYWLVKQVGLLVWITVRYSMRHYYFDRASDPLNICAN